MKKKDMTSHPQIFGWKHDEDSIGPWMLDLYTKLIKHFAKNDGYHSSKKVENLLQAAQVLYLFYGMVKSGKVDTKDYSEPKDVIDLVSKETQTGELMKQIAALPEEKRSAILEGYIKSQITKIVRFSYREKENNDPLSVSIYSQAVHSMRMWIYIAGRMYDAKITTSTGYWGRDKAYFIIIAMVILRKNAFKFSFDDIKLIVRKKTGLREFSQLIKEVFPEGTFAADFLKTNEFKELYKKFFSESISLLVLCKKIPLDESSIDSAKKFRNELTGMAQIVSSRNSFLRRKRDLDPEKASLQKDHLYKLGIYQLANLCKVNPATYFFLDATLLHRVLIGDKDSTLAPGLEMTVDKKTLEAARKFVNSPISIGDAVRGILAKDIVVFGKSFDYKQIARDRIKENRGIKTDKAQITRLSNIVSMEMVRRLNPEEVIQTLKIWEQELDYSISAYFSQRVIAVLVRYYKCQTLEEYLKGDYSFYEPSDIDRLVKKIDERKVNRT